ncbi:MAG: hypothetical protein R2867_40385 [Caldilineaceae bacterium]
MRSMANDAALVGGPLAGGVLLALIGLQGVLWIDVVTFFVAAGTLIWCVFLTYRPLPLVIHPQPARLVNSCKMGFTFIYARKGLLGLTLLFTGIMFFAPR